MTGGQSGHGKPSLKRRGKNNGRQQFYGKNTAQQKIRC
uniref:Uncharacterized protein n=1 Tax=Leclercia adecarboxylata TaxID=83655 RepID=A0A6H0A418_9ENTR|nr:hypothetical protein [Leclercia adecarboxylata]